MSEADWGLDGDGNILAPDIEEFALAAFPGAVLMRIMANGKTVQTGMHPDTADELAKQLTVAAADARQHAINEAAKSLSARSNRDAG